MTTTAPNPEAITDAEAEQVLLALGPQIEWSGERYGTITQFGTVPGEFVYRYRVDKIGIIYFARFWQEGNFGDFNSQKAVPNACAAKSACERHYQTGKWE